jgi:hypothetical protein
MEAANDRLELLRRRAADVGEFLMRLDHVLIEGLDVFGRARQFAPVFACAIRFLIDGEAAFHADLLEQPATLGRGRDQDELSFPEPVRDTLKVQEHAEERAIEVRAVSKVDPEWTRTLSQVAFAEPAHGQALVHPAPTEHLDRDATGIPVHPDGAMLRRHNQSL